MNGLINAWITDEINDWMMEYMSFFISRISFHNSVAIGDLLISDVTKTQTLKALTILSFSG